MATAANSGVKEEKVKKMQLSQLSTVTNSACLVSDQLKRTEVGEGEKEWQERTKQKGERKSEELLVSCSGYDTVLEYRRTKDRKRKEIKLFMVMSA